MITVAPATQALSRMHGLLQGVIAPRPIAFVSTVDIDGNVNLSPFSFFNLFSTNPPIVVFSPSRRGRNNTTKHTYDNVLQIPEVVINIVNFSMVEQTSLASVEYPKGVSEFKKSGLTAVPSHIVKPPRVLESPAALECKVNEVVPLGREGGAGNLVLCEIVLVHVRKNILDATGSVDPQKLDAVARMGNDFYCRAHGASIFSIPKPNEKPAVGFDAIPERARQSNVLTGNDLGRLGNIEQLPDDQQVEEFSRRGEVRNLLAAGEEAVHREVQKLVRENRLDDAWKWVLASSR
jgi:flavin reductase (DIM6/NTAB) family NADH-FMN oxidoreductase RutF